MRAAPVLSYRFIKTNPSTMYRPPDPIRITEDGEAIGTLRQFATSFALSPTSVLECLRREANDAVILHAGNGPSRVLIVDVPALNALRRCTSRASRLASSPAG